VKRPALRTFILIPAAQLQYKGFGYFFSSILKGANFFYQQVHMTADNDTTLTNTLFCAVFVISALIRLYCLGQESIWLDEAYSLKFSSYAVTHIFSQKESNPPLYYIFMHYWISLFGNSEFSLRLPSALFAIVSIPTLYRFGIRIAGRKAGLLASLFLTISVFHLFYSQEARVYSLLLLLSLFSMSIFHLLLSRPNARLCIAYVFFSVLLVYSHIYGLFIILCQNICFAACICLDRKSCRCTRQKWLYLQLCVLALFAPWLPILLDQIFFIQADYWWLSRPDLSTLYTTFLSFSNNSVVILILYVAFAALSCFPLYRSASQSAGKPLRSLLKAFFKTNRDVSLLALWLVIPIVFPYIISQLSSSIYFPRYTIVSLPALYLLTAKGLCRLRFQRARLIIVIVILIFSVQPLWQYFSGPHKSGWRKLVEYIDTHAHHDDLLVFNSFICKDLLFNYYSQREDLINTSSFPDVPFEAQFKDPTVDVVDDAYKKALRSLANRHDRIWVISAYSSDIQRKRIRTILSMSHKMLDHKRFFGKHVYLFTGMCRESPAL